MAAMARQDYILRMIEQIGQFLVELRKLIVGGGAGGGSVEQQLRSASQQAGLDLALARVATAETLMLLVAPTGEVEPGRCWLCAETLYLDGLNAELVGRLQEARDRYAKARLLFSMVAPMGVFLVGLPEAADRIRDIDDRLAGLDSPPPPAA